MHTLALWYCTDRQTLCCSAAIIVACSVDSLHGFLLQTRASKYAAKTLETKCLTTLWGKTFQLRAPELAYAIVFDPSKDSPWWASVVGCFVDLNRAIRKKPEIGASLTNMLQERGMLTLKKAEVCFLKHLIAKNITHALKLSSVLKLWQLLKAD